MTLFFCSLALDVERKEMKSELSTRQLCQPPLYQSKATEQQMTTEIRELLRTGQGWQQFDLKAVTPRFGLLLLK